MSQASSTAPGRVPTVPTRRSARHYQPVTVRRLGSNRRVREGYVPRARVGGEVT